MLSPQIYNGSLQTLARCLAFSLLQPSNVAWPGQFLVLKLTVKELGGWSAKLSKNDAPVKFLAGVYPQPPPQNSAQAPCRSCLLSAG